MWYEWHNVIFAISGKPSEDQAQSSQATNKMQSNLKYLQWNEERTNKKTWCNRLSINNNNNNNNDDDDDAADDEDEDVDERGQWNVQLNIVNILLWNDKNRAATTALSSSNNTQRTKSQCRRALIKVVLKDKRSGFGLQRDNKT